jgi:hypothetical protein
MPMQVLRDTASIRSAVSNGQDPELLKLIGKRIDELSEYIANDLGELINIFVIEPNDTLIAVQAQLGFELLDRPLDAAENHSCWYELTFVLSDDGFGAVVFVPKHPSVDARLLAMCAACCTEPLP